MQAYNLAQINIAQLIAPEGDPRVQEFFANVPSVNQLAESSEGFIWRFEDDHPDPMVAFNMSVWRSIESLAAFAYRSGHIEFLRKRDQWFTPMDENYMALWWVPAGHLPSSEEGLKRLQQLNEVGPSSAAFTFKQRFNPPG